MNGLGVAAAVATLSVGTYAAGEAVLATVDVPATDGVSDPWYVTVSFAAMVTAYAVVGALVTRREPRNPVGWLLVGAALSMAVTSQSYGWASVVLLGGADLPGGVAAAWVTTWSWTPLLLAVPTLLFLLFPGGHPVSPAWRPVVPLALVSLAVVLLGTALGTGPMAESPAETVTNPVGVVPARLADGAVAVGWAACLLGMLLAATSLVLRFRRSVGVERQQLRWLCWSCAALPTFLLVGMAISALRDDDAGAFADAALALSLATIPVAAGIAILRHRLYDIDLVVNRALVYGSLTATLAVTYLISVLALQGLLPRDSDLSVTASTLAVAALFGPLRNAIQRLVDRRFHRSRYDAAIAVGAFSGRLRHEVDLESVGTDLRGVVRDTVQPEHVSLWLREPARSAS